LDGPEEQEGLVFSGKWIAQVVIFVPALSVSVCPIHATSIIVDFTPERIILVADSRTGKNDVDVDRNIYRDDSCKLAVLGRVLIFASTGYFAYTPRSSADFVPEWQVGTEAVKALALVSDHDPLKIAQTWANNITGYFQTFYFADPQRVRELSAYLHNFLLTGIFAGKSLDGSLIVNTAFIRFDGDRPIMPLLNSVGKLEQRDRPYSTNDVTQELIDQKTERARKAADAWKKLAVSIPLAERQLRWLEYLIEQTGIVDATVGGKANVLRVTRDGSASWLDNQTCKSQ
jgi:hypothetical protein